MFDTFHHKSFQPSVLKGSTEPTKVVTKHLKVLIGRSIILNARIADNDYANYLVDSVKVNTFTSNNHYLTDTTKEVENRYDTFFENLSADSYKLEMQPHFHDVVCGLRAFSRPEQLWNKLTFKKQYGVVKCIIQSPVALQNQFRVSGSQHTVVNTTQGENSNICCQVRISGSHTIVNRTATMYQNIWFSYYCKYYTRLEEQHYHTIINTKVVYTR